MEWPLFDLRLSIGDVALRPVTDADLVVLAAIFPQDNEQDPASERFDKLAPDRDRGRLFVQGIWRNRGTWSPSSWCLDFAVEVEGRLVGLQALEGDAFAKLRTVDSASWLATDARGRGTGLAMRTAALALAFDHLGAVAAVSSARRDNTPSLAVSRRLGYADNGISRTDSPTGVVELQHLRLTREDWRSGGHRVEVAGLGPCLPWFALGSAGSDDGTERE